MHTSALNNVQNVYCVICVSPRLIAEILIENMDRALCVYLYFAHLGLEDTTEIRSRLVTTCQGVI
jgi:succinyl-CoA synthetase alpha subunit